MLSSNIYFNTALLRNLFSERFSLDCRKGLVWFWFWFYYALWLASIFTLVLVLRQSSENRSIKRMFIFPCCYVYLYLKATNNIFSGATKWITRAFHVYKSHGVEILTLSIFIRLNEVHSFVR